MNDLSEKRILLVEDNAHNRRIFAGILSHHGYAVIEASNGKEAIKLARSETPDLILMDLSLPVMDGWTATRELKKLSNLKDVQIIALTAHAMSGDRERALEAGCDGYLSKPISPKHLAAEVHRLLNSDNERSASS